MLWLDDSFDEFDIWCLRQGLEFSSLTSRRLIALVYEYITIGLDKEAIQNLEYQLEDIGRKIFDPPAPDEVQPPDWWVPEERNWNNIQAFLGTASTIEGAVSQVKEVSENA